MKPRVREAILVEGRYDKNTLSQVVDATIFETSGFGIFRDREKIQFLRQVAEKRGMIIFTDSDGAGFVIRNRLKSMLPPDRLLQAYIPDIPGKERRKDKASKAGLLGVEGMTPEIILNSLRRCGAHFLEETAPAAGTLTRQDLYTLGLNLPQQLATGGFLDALNLLTDREELENLLKEYENCTAQ
jgi:ribonuclease M5